MIEANSRNLFRFVVASDILRDDLSAPTSVGHA